MTTYQKQRQLYFLGYYGGEIDGKWGAKSRAATEEFQRDFGLKVDGVFGEKTEAKSIEVVKDIQEAVGAIADGIVGTDTIKATKVFQKNNGLKADGIAGEKTRAKIGVAVVDFWENIKYFKKSEFACKCKKYCNGFPVDINHTVVRIAERARKEFGKPCIISSGVRCEKHNKNVGGVSNSRHKLGKAMDLNVQGISSAKLVAWAKNQPEVRYTYAIDSYYAHIDVK